MGKRVLESGLPRGLKLSLESCGTCWVVQLMFLVVVAWDGNCLKKATHHTMTGPNTKYSTTFMLGPFFIWMQFSNKRSRAKEHGACIIYEGSYDKIQFFVLRERHILEFSSCSCTSFTFSGVRNNAIFLLTYLPPQLLLHKYNEISEKFCIFLS